MLRETLKPGAHSEDVTPPSDVLQLPTDARCLGCGYSLQQLTVPRCPECGRGFDPSNPLTVRVGTGCLLALMQLVVPMFAWIIVTAATAVSILCVDGEYWVTAGGAICLGAVIGLLARSSFRRWLIRDLEPGAIRSDRRWTVGLILLFAFPGLYLSLDKWSCGHSAAWRIGPYEVTWTSDPTCRRLPDTPRHPMGTRWGWYDYREGPNLRVTPSPFGV